MEKQIYGGRFVSVPSKLPADRQDLGDAPFPYKDSSLDEAKSYRRIYVRAENANLAALLMMGIYAQREKGKEWIPKKSRSKESVIVARYIGTLEELKIRGKMKKDKVKISEIEKP